MGAYPEIGYEIKVQMVKDPEQKLYSSKIADIKADAFIIELLLDPENQISLAANEPIIVYFSSLDHYYEHSLYEFKATVLKSHKDFIKISKPTEKEITRFQRREFLRFYCNIAATFKITSSSVSEIDNKIHKATIMNLSASGAGLQSKKGVSLQDAVELNFHFAEDNVRPTDVKVAGEVVRVDCSDEGEFNFAVKFTDISENDRRMIMDSADNYFRKLRKRLLFLK